MNVSYYTSQVSQIHPLSIPGTLWSYYLEYLVFYESDSWVATVAHSFRVFAFLVALPFIILGLLDIASYGIARTLGVIDDTKASTSDKATVHMVSSTPSIQINGTMSTSSESPFSDSDAEANSLHAKSRTTPASAQAEETLSQPSVFFSSENNLKLSGVDVFSPAASQPPSPTTSRRHLPLGDQTLDTLRHRTHNTIKEEDEQNKR